MREYTLNMGDVATTFGEARYTCFGLGSCIGLFLQDRLTGLSGGAHILLPELEKGPLEYAKFYNVTSALTELLHQLKLNGSDLTCLRAKITGGANVINVNTQTGSRNVQSVIKQLTELKIFIAATDVGGTYFRTAKFESDTGLLSVKIPQINECRTY
jgi:chemotaxis protein CheD